MLYVVHILHAYSSSECLTEVKVGRLSFDVNKIFFKCVEIVLEACRGTATCDLIDQNLATDFFFNFFVMHSKLLQAA